jgi:hypothetical protein
MINAKAEIAQYLVDVKCAEIHYQANYNTPDVRIVLKSGFTSTDLDIFLGQMDFTYDEGYGSQHLFGHIWYLDGTWAERSEYDGSEAWSYCKAPTIPEDLQ